MAIKAQQTDQDNTPINAKDYQSIVRSLLYLTHTRPYIVHVVKKVCQHVQQPTMGDFKTVKRILRYVKGTLHFGLHFSQ